PADGSWWTRSFTRRRIIASGGGRRPAAFGPGTGSPTSMRKKPMFRRSPSDSCGYKSICGLPGASPMDHENKDRVADRVQFATAEALASTTCPDCGGGLDAQYTPRGRGALAVLCPHCRWRVVRDGIAIEPPWVRELGPKVRTGREPMAARPRP